MKMSIPYVNINAMISILNKMKNNLPHRSFFCSKHHLQKVINSDINNLFSENIPSLTSMLNHQRIWQKDDFLKQLMNGKFTDNKSTQNKVSANITKNNDKLCYCYYPKKNTILTISKFKTILNKLIQGYKGIKKTEQQIGIKKHQLYQKMGDELDEVRQASKKYHYIVVPMYRTMVNVNGKRQSTKQHYFLPRADDYDDKKQKMVAKNGKWLTFKEISNLDALSPYVMPFARTKHIPCNHHWQVIDLNKPLISQLQYFCFCMMLNGIGDGRQWN